MAAGSVSSSSLLKNGISLAHLKLEGLAEIEIVPKIKRIWNTTRASNDSSEAFFSEGAFRPLLERIANCTIEAYVSRYSARVGYYYLILSDLQPLRVFFPEPSDLSLYPFVIINTANQVIQRLGRTDQKSPPEYPLSKFIEDVTENIRRITPESYQEDLPDFIREVITLFLVTAPHEEINLLEIISKGMLFIFEHHYKPRMGSADGSK